MKLFRNFHGNSPLHFAACNNNLYIVKMLLKHPKINVNSEDAVLAIFDLIGFFKKN